MAGFLDAPAQFVERFQPGLLGCQQTKHHKAIFRHMSQWFKASRALIVVFEQEALKAGLSKYARNGFIVTTGIELALVVTPADVNAKGDAGMIANDGIVHLNTCIDDFIGVVPALAIPLAHLRIKKRGILGSIDLDVSAS